MLKIYCTECGNPTTYTSAKPKFCSACGQPFDKSISNPTNQKVVTSQPKKIIPKVNAALNNEDDDFEDNYDGDVNYVPKINNLDVEIDKAPSTKTRIGDIIGSSKSVSKREKIKAKNATKAERQKFLEDFKREAGAIRPKSRGRSDG